MTISKEEMKKRGYPSFMYVERITTGRHKGSFVKKHPKSSLKRPGPMRLPGSNLWKPTVRKKQKPRVKTPVVKEEKCLEINEDEEKDIVHRNVMEELKVDPNCRFCDMVHIVDCPLFRRRPTNRVVIIEEAITCSNSSLCSLQTLPVNMCLYRVDNHGLSIFTWTAMEKGTTFGPLKGVIMNPDQVTTASDFTHIWIIEGEPDTLPTLISTADEATSNWCR